MKLLSSKLKKQQELHNDKKVPFVCVENVGRSQMAEGFFPAASQILHITTLFHLET
jgi:hypothetical protein